MKSKFCWLTVMLLMILYGNCGEYDWNRYQKDKDYADGVDDAMEELDEDW